ncbi:helix-turn-helix transcriptional regulator [Microbacterium aerolatum]|uniref:DeoR family transcriptional regulator n=1 Tax=Microbacterium aerolatum TaxID=153731 RepID=A0A511AGS4_9MICO|nr:WYL domain-containing protein [Microbacterium aerolatum]GEK86543.1 DeoR family transcriptional regulator [Microbacterium aerolatum]GGB34072.1 DeoR family transcriptional regulator [Microbacterium aerolatum]
MTGSSSRMLALLSLLQTQRDWPGHVLAERLEVSPRTVRRDVDRLRELGYRIGAIKGPDGGYRLAAGSELPPLLFDDDQAVAIAVALQTASTTGVDIGESAERALATVRQVMPSRLRHRIDGIRFTGAQNASAKVDPAVLEAVSATARDRQVLRFDYGADHDRPPRRTEPHAVVAREGRWYLLAWDLEADDWRIFRLDRMSPRIPTGPSFTPRALPAVDAETYLAARAKGSDAEDRWPCVGEVVIDLPAREIIPWIGDGTLEEIDADSCRITVGSWSWTGVLASIVRFEAPFTIVGPEPLREAAEALARRLISAAR